MGNILNDQRSKIEYQKFFDSSIIFGIISSVLIIQRFPNYEESKPFTRMNPEFIITYPQVHLMFSECFGQNSADYQAIMTKKMILI